MVTVKTIANHYSNNVMRKVGDEYETTKQHAEQLKGSGLVEYDGEAKKYEGEPLVHAGVKEDTGMTTTAVINQPEEAEGELVTANKKELDAKKTATDRSKKKEKVEGNFPGSETTE